MSRGLFTIRVFKIVRAISIGSVLSYGEVASRAGNSNAARAVGSLMQRNYDLSIPCHRVISSDGTLGGFNRGLKEKIRQLKAEGVVIKNGRVLRRD